MLGPVAIPLRTETVRPSGRFWNSAVDESGEDQGCHNDCIAVSRQSLRGVMTHAYPVDLACAASAGRVVIGGANVCLAARERQTVAQSYVECLGCTGIGPWSLISGFAKRKRYT